MRMTKFDGTTLRNHRATPAVVHQDAVYGLDIRGWQSLLTKYKGFPNCGVPFLGVSL